MLEWMGLNFYDYDGIQPKLSPPKHFSRQCIDSFNESLLEKVMNIFVSNSVLIFHCSNKLGNQKLCKCSVFSCESETFLETYYGHNLLLVTHIATWLQSMVQSYKSSLKFYPDFDLSFFWNIHTTQKEHISWFFCVCLVLR